jgi:RNA polymerase sigma-70 factor (ECF subfamily)
MEGDTEAFAQLVRQQQSYVFNLALSLLGEVEEAQDLAQDALLRVWQRLPSFRGEARFTTWLYRLVVNLGLNRLARMRRLPLPLVLDDHSLHNTSRLAADPQEIHDGVELQEAIWREVDALPDKYRLVITLYYQQEQSYDEIAEILQLPLNTVKTHLARARHILASRLAGLQGEQR